MADMLVKLYTLQVDWPAIAALQQRGITLRKPLGSEKISITQWVQAHFSSGWVSEVDVAIAQRPANCLIAVAEGKLLGFACYDAAALGFFGPMGIAPAYQGQGIGKSLLQLTLFDMQLKGYGYAIIGFVGPAEFYSKVVGAVEIPDSTPGLWQTGLKN
jgi:GNAT superfamily N-acetyltransferase